MSIQVTEKGKNVARETKIVVYEEGSEPPKKKISPKTNKRKPSSEETIAEFASSIEIQRVLRRLLESKSKNEQLCLDAEKYREITLNWEGKLDLRAIAKRFELELEYFKILRGKSFRVENVEATMQKGFSGIRDCVRVQFNVDQFEKKYEIFVLEKGGAMSDFESVWWSLRTDISSSSDDEAEFAVNPESLKMEGSKDHRIMLD